MSFVVKAENLFFSYTGSPPYVLDGINLEIHAGEYVSVVGDNGSGKSTLMRLILRFIRPTGGSIACRAKRVGYVPQRNDFSNSNFPITVYEALNSYRRLLKIKNKDPENTDCAGADGRAGSAYSGRTLDRGGYRQPKRNLWFFEENKQRKRHYRCFRRAQPGCRGFQFNPDLSSDGRTGAPVHSPAICGRILEEQRERR